MALGHPAVGVAHHRAPQSMPATANMPSPDATVAPEPDAQQRPIASNLKNGYR